VTSTPHGRLGNTIERNAEPETRAYIIAVRAGYWDYLRGCGYPSGSAFADPICRAARAGRTLGWVLAELRS